MIDAQIIIPPSPFLTNDWVFPPLGSLYIKRFCEERSLGEMRINVVQIGKKGVKLDHSLPTGFSCTTPQYAGALAAKFLFTGKKIVGGPHCAHYDVSKDGWDFVIKGDGCHAFYSILRGLPITNTLDSPDQLPYRDESLHKYKYLLDGNPTTVIMSARGCPNGCYFCEDAGTAVRLKSPMAVKKELKECVRLGFTGIMFFDDLFCINPRRVEKLCEVIEPFKIKFRCFAHARNFSNEMAATLKDAGCVEIGFGAESASQRVLDNINKRTTVQQNYEIVKLAHTHGIRVKAFTMLGLPGDDEESAAALEKYVTTSGVDDFDVSIYMPYQGTYIAEHAAELGYEFTTQDGICGYYKGKDGSSECAVSLKGFPLDRIKYWQERIISGKTTHL